MHALFTVTTQICLKEGVCLYKYFSPCRTRGWMESSHRTTLDGTAQKTSPPCVPTGPNGSGKGWGSVPRMGGTWPVSFSASCPSFVSWCLLFRKCFIPLFNFFSECAELCDGRVLSRLFSLVAGSTTARGRKGIWTAPCPSGSCCCGWQEIPVTWWAPIWPISFLFR